MSAINYVPWIISIMSVLVTLYSLFHKENKDKSDKDMNMEMNTQVSLAKLDVKLGMILDSMNEIKTAQIRQDKRMDSLSERVTKLEEIVRREG